MKFCNRFNQKKTLSIFAVLVAAITLLALVSGPTLALTAPQSDMVAKCKVDLANRLKLKTEAIKLIDAKPTVWPDASLGMPVVDKLYAQVETPGLRIILEARSSNYFYAASAKMFRYGGPVSAWACSMLYLESNSNDPNLNGDLYQCSLMETNSVLLASQITNYYPQEKGVVIATRRTSRSGFDLLYVQADEPGKDRILSSAFDFGAIAVNANDEWAGFVRPTLGATWNVVVASTHPRVYEVDPNAVLSGVHPGEQTIALPEGAKPGQIAWSGEKLMILVKKGNKTVCFETSPKAASPQWKEVAEYLFPRTSFMLNKSQSLEVKEIKDNGKPVVEVAIVWFTGSGDVKARIPGLTLKGYDLLNASYVFIWGEKDSKPTAYTVDYQTGEVIPSYHGDSQDVKPFTYLLHENPTVQK